MSKIKPERAHAKKIFDGFVGVSAVKSSCEDRLRSVTNFRIRENGILEKRCGFRTFASFPVPLRGYWEGTVGGVAYAFAVCERNVFRLSNGATANVTTISSSEGAVRFFLYVGNLYLLDGCYVYVFDEDSERFKQTDGYVPLYGRNWHPTDYGNLYEEVNLFSPKLRVHYANTVGTTEFRLPFYAITVDKVRIDNTTVTGYSLNAAGDTVTVPYVGGSVEIAFTMSVDRADLDELYQCTEAFTDRIDGFERLILYGSPTGNSIFCSSNVSQSMLNFCKVHYPSATPLYFKSTGRLTVGAPEAPVTALCRNHDRVLAFHPMGASSISFDPESDRVTEYPLLQGLGCCVRSIGLSPEGKPLLLNERGVFRLSSLASEPDAFQVTDLTSDLDEVRELCNHQDTILFHDTVHGELWLRDPCEARGRVWILRLADGEWYCFEGIHATFFCKINGNSGFANDGTLLVFDEDLCSDNGAPIEASLETDYLTLSYPELTKRSLCISVFAESRGLTSLTVETERGSQIRQAPANVTSGPDLIDLRTHTKRFRFVRIRLSDLGTTRSRYRRLALYANL